MGAETNRRNRNQYASGTYGQVNIPNSGMFNNQSVWDAAKSRGSINGSLLTPEQEQLNNSMKLGSNINNNQQAPKTNSTSSIIDDIMKSKRPDQYASTDFSLSNMLKNKDGDYTLNSVISPFKTAFDGWATYQGIQNAEKNTEMMQKSMDFSQMDSNRKYALTSDAYFSQRNRALGSRADYANRHSPGKFYTPEQASAMMANSDSGAAPDGFLDGINDGKNYVPASSSALYRGPGSRVATSQQVPVAQQGIPALAMNDVSANAIKPTHMDRTGKIIRKKRKKKRAPSESPESGTSKDNAQVV